MLIHFQTLSAGDKGVSYYQGASSLSGRMTSTSLENIPSEYRVFLFPWVVDIYLSWAFCFWVQECREVCVGLLFCGAACVIYCKIVSSLYVRLCCMRFVFLLREEVPSTFLWLDGFCRTLVLLYFFFCKSRVQSLAILLLRIHMPKRDKCISENLCDVPCQVARVRYARNLLSLRSKTKTRCGARCKPASVGPNTNFLIYIFLRLYRHRPCYSKKVMRMRLWRMSAMQERRTNKTESHFFAHARAKKKCVFQKKIK